jgi:hypothetical protein
MISPLIIILELPLKFIMIQLEFFTTLYEKGDFIEQVTEQLYDAKADLSRPFCNRDLPKMWQ